MWARVQQKEGQRHLRAEQPHDCALHVAVPEADEAADEDAEPEGARAEQVLRDAKLGHVVRAQRLLHQREQDLRGIRDTPSALDVTVGARRQLAACSAMR